MAHGGRELCERWLQYGRHQSTQRNHEAAIHSFNQAVACSPSNEEVWHSRGSVLEELGRLEEAACSYVYGLKWHPEDTDLLIALAEASIILGRHTDALESYDSLIYGLHGLDGCEDILKTLKNCRDTVLKQIEHTEDTTKHGSKNVNTYVCFSQPIEQGGGLKQGKTKQQEQVTEQSIWQEIFAQVGNNIDSNGSEGGDGQHVSNSCKHLPKCVRGHKDWAGLAREFVTIGCWVMALRSLERVSK